MNPSLYEPTPRLDQNDFESYEDYKEACDDVGITPEPRNDY
jgi:hypothetical protein